MPDDFGICGICGREKQLAGYGACGDCMGNCEEANSRKIECDLCGHLFPRHDIAKARDGNICRKCINRKDKNNGQDSHRL